METELCRSWKYALIVAFVIPIIAFLIVLSQTQTVLNVVMSACVFILLFPIAYIGLYMWATGTGKTSVNGFDWSKYDDEQAKYIVSKVGLYIAVIMAVMAVSCSLIAWNIWGGVIAIIIATAILVVGLIYIYSRKDVPHFKEVGRNKILAGFIIITLLLVPCCGLLMNDTVTKETVEISMSESSISVRAPFTDYTIEYKDIDSVKKVYGFDKGDRVSGQSSGDICSGKWHNSAYGDYTLAMYSSNSTVVSIHTNSGYYVFNLQTEQKTLDLYGQLVEKTK